MADYACALLLQHGRILLGRRAVHRKLYPGLWDVIGGRVEEGESLASALERELREEIGVLPLTQEPLGVIVDDVPRLGGVQHYHMFLVRHWRGGDPRICNSEHTELAWFTPETARDMDDLALEAYRELFSTLAAKFEMHSRDGTG